MSKPIHLFLVMMLLGGIAGLITGCASSKELIAPCKRPADMKPFAPISQMDCQVMMPVNNEGAVPASPIITQ